MKENLEAARMINAIYQLRNDLIKEFLDERSILSYLSHNYKISEMTSSRMSRIKGDLRDLLLMPIGIERCDFILQQMKLEGVSISDTDQGVSGRFFFTEIEMILKKHAFGY